MGQSDTNRIRYLVVDEDDWDPGDGDYRKIRYAGANLDKAMAHCRRIVDEFLDAVNTHGTSAEQLLKRYRIAGEKPLIITAAGERRANFVADKYALRRCKILCAPPIPTPPDHERNHEPPRITPELEAKDRAILSEVLGKEVPAPACTSPDIPAPRSEGGRGPPEIRELPPCVTSAAPAPGSTSCTETFSVRILDMFHHGDPDEEFTISGFKTFEAAREYARRRTRDSVEENRPLSTSPQELREQWFMFGEDCLVLGGEYSGFEELDFFITNPATAEERDYVSLKPSWLHE